jgi:oligoendopeptidase F
MVTWNLEDIYKENEKEQILLDLKSKVELFISMKNLLNPNVTSNDLLIFLKLKEEIISIVSKLEIKTYLKHCEDVTNSETTKEMQNQEMLLTNYENQLMFFEDFIKNLEQSTANKLEKELGEYQYFFNAIRKSIPHLRTLEEEKIMNYKDLSGSSALETLRSLITGKFVFDFEGEKITESKLSSYTQNEEEGKRINAYNSMLAKYKDYQDELGEIYKAKSLDWFNESVNIRHYNSSISARNFANTLDDEIINIIIDLTKKHKSLFHKYFLIKSKILKLKNTRYNVYAPYILNSKKVYDYEKSKNITMDLFNSFSEEFYDLANFIFQKNHVHSEIKSNKKSGAFCYSYDKNKVPYILLNHNDDLNSLLTMAHEFGHGIHGQLAKDKTQMTYHSATAIAETASIFAEMMMMDKLEKESNKEEKIFLLLHHIDGIFASILRQIYFVIFEIEAHKKISEGTSPNELSEIYYNLLKEQFGEEMQIDKIFSYEWLRIPHIYETPFYCYSYAFGNLLVLALYQKYIEAKNKDDFLKEYTKILSCGGDKDIKDILLEANIDIEDKSFWEEAFNKISKDIDKLNSLIN